MAASSDPEDDYFARPGPAQVGRLRQFFRYDIPVNYLIVVAMVAIWYEFRFWSLLVIAAAVVANIGLLHWSRAQLGKNRLESAALGIATGVIVLVLGGMYLSGGVGLPILALLTLWPVMIALPYLRKRSLLRLMLVSTGSALALGLMAFHGDSIGLTKSIPSWVWLSIDSLCLPLFVGFMCLFVWHYSSNLTDVVRKLRSANTQLQSSERRLEQKVAERTRELEAKNQELLKLDEMKTQFVSTASHELRSPLTAIRAFSEMLANDPELHQPQAEFAQIINAETERLARLATELLDLSRMEAGYADWKPRAVDIGAELRSIYDAQRAVAGSKGLRLELALPEDLPSVWADPDGLRRVLLNLVDNGLKFTTQGSVVLIAAKADQHVRVSVCDTGPGISQADQAHVFERFYQAGNMLTEKPPGAGLGLAICREILAQHHSRLRLQSTPGQGSCFSFELAVSPEPANQAVPG